MVEDISWTQELVRGVTTFTAVIIGGWITLKNYRSSKWWDAKLEAYDEVMVALEVCAHWYRLTALSYINEDWGDPSLEEKKTFKDAYAKLRSRESRAKFMLSDAARNVLHELSESLSWVDSETSPGEIYFEMEGCYKTALADFVFQARVDMKMAGFYSRLAHLISVTRERVKKWVRRSPRFRYFRTTLLFGDSAGERDRRRFTHDGREMPEVFWKNGRPFS
jgi:hypothetical protein